MSQLPAAAEPQAEQSAPGADGPGVRDSRATDALRHWASWLVPIAAWSGASLYYFSQFVRHPSHGIVGGPDGIIYGWFFQSVEHALAHGHNPFVSTAMNAPTGINLMWNTSVILAAIVLAPVTALAGGLAVAGWLMVLAPVLSASVAYYVLRRFSARAAGCAVAASVYGFGPFFAGQAGHLHLTLAAASLPLLLLVGERLFVSQTGSPIRWGGWLGLIVAATMLISEEVVVIAVVIAIAAVVAGLIARRELATRERLLFARTGVAAAIVVAVVLLAVPLYYQFFGRLALRSGVKQGNQPLDLAGLVRPSDLQYYARASDVAANKHFLANGAENTGYLGLPLIVLLIVIVVWLVRRKDPFVWWWTLTAAAGLVLSFGTRLWVNGHATDIPLPWYAIRQLPLVHSTVTVRITLVTTLFVALILAYWLGRLPAGRAYAAGIAAVAICLVPLRPVHGGLYAEIDHVVTPRFFTTSAVDAIRPGSTVLVLPQGESPFAAQYPMYWQIRAAMRFNIVGGYAVFDVDGKSSYISPLPAVATTLMDAAITGAAPSDAQIAVAKLSLPAAKIQYIVITNQLPHPDLAAQAAADITGCTPRPVADVVVCELAS